MNKNVTAGHDTLVPWLLTHLCFSDCNGRVTHDGRQGLDISYNILNLPSVVTNEDGMDTRYRYLSDGTRRSVSSGDESGSGTVLYLGAFVYDLYTDASDDALDFTELQSVATPEGRLMPSEDGVIDLWYGKDHLGNVRDIVSISDLPQVLEKNDYLPFGTRIVNASAPVLEDNRWRYAGKEEQAFLIRSDKCALIDFGARLYDPWTARWTTPDPMAGKYASMAPHNYCAGNPLMFVDPEGMWIDIHDGDSLYRYDNGKILLYNKTNASFEECHVKPGSFVELVYVSLLHLRNSATGDDLVSFFNNNDNNVRIHPGETPDARNGMMNSTKMVLNPLGKGSDIPTENGIQESPLWLDLGHELAYRKDFIERGYKKATKKWCGGFPDSEKVATHYENLIRQEMNLPLRTHYAIEEPINSPYQPSWLIRSNSESRFYRGVFYIPFSQRNL